MLYVWIGSISFLLFVLSDLNEVRFQRKFLLFCFPVGCILLASATTLLIVSQPADLHFATHWIFLTGLIAVLSFVMLIFSLTVVHSRQEQPIVDPSRKRRTYDRGFYAMCRHPGVLFFALFYASLALALERSMLLSAGCCFILLNIAYSLYQDHFILPKLLMDYDRYHDRTPFLIPTIDSLGRGIRTLGNAEAIVR